MLSKLGSCVNLSDHALNTYLSAEMLLLTKRMLSLAEAMSNRPRAIDAMHVCSGRGIHDLEDTERLMTR